MKFTFGKVILTLSLAANIFALRYWAEEHLQLQSMYRRNVDYAAELAYAIGYHKALGHDLKKELESYPTRLPLKTVTDNRVEAIIWPAKRQSISLDFSNPLICNASIWEEQ